MEHTAEALPELAPDLVAMTASYPAGFLTQNIILDLAILSWFFAQFGKLVLHLIFHRKLDFSFLLASGGMPSSHSSFVCSAAASVGAIYGFGHPIFGLTAIFAMVVMYDACHVRRTAGEQAKLLNELMKNWSGVTTKSMEQGLRVILGHTPAQVLTGGAIGVATGYLGVTLL